MSNTRLFPSDPMLHEASGKATQGTESQVTVD